MSLKSVFSQQSQVEGGLGAAGEPSGMSSMRLRYALRTGNSGRMSDRKASGILMREIGGVQC